MYPSMPSASPPAPHRPTAAPATGAATSGAARRSAHLRTRDALLALMILAAAALGTGCSNSCDALADLICACAPNQLEENACQETVKANRALHTPTRAELDACSRSLAGVLFEL